MVSAQPRRGSDVPTCETPGKPSLLTVTQGHRRQRSPWLEGQWNARSTSTAPRRRTVDSGRPGRDHDRNLGRRKRGPCRHRKCPGQRLRDGGTYFDGTVTQTVTVTADTSNLGIFSISDGATSANGDVTCLFISGPGAVVGVHLDFGPGSDLFGLIFITDGGPTGPDTLLLGVPSPDGPADCTTSAEPGTLLSSGDFTVFVFPVGSPPPSAEPTPGETPTETEPVPSGPISSGPPSGPPTPRDTTGTTTGSPNSLPQASGDPSNRSSTRHWRRPRPVPSSQRRTRSTASWTLRIRPRASRSLWDRERREPWSH